jgi:hypothetical protein
MTDDPSPLGGDPPPWEIEAARADLARWETGLAVDRSDRGENGRFIAGNPGRPKGIPSKNTAAARALAARLAGIEPLAFMLKGLGFIHAEIIIEEQSDRPNKNVLTKLYDRGMGYARDAAPYCHGKFATINHTAQLEGPPLDLRSLNDEQLDILILRLQRGTQRPIIDGTVAEGGTQEPGSDEPSPLPE